MKFSDKSAARATALHRFESLGLLEADRRATIEEMRDALAAGLIVPYYQPRISISSGRIVGFEALARWRHPTRGVLMPSQFAMALGDPEIAIIVGRAMLQQSISDLRGWLAFGLDCGCVAVNLSAADFDHPSLIDAVLDTLAGAGVPAASFELELTEAVRYNALAGIAIDRLNGAGVKITLDDFGTGHASLAHLIRLPVDWIRITESFIRRLDGHGGQ
jgi:EAL domain-containing protein (putative c-di-GMP-specific phosphodiesterase class I)